MAPPLQKPPRTLGLSLAILASVMLFTLLPLLQVSVFFAVQYRFSQINLPVDPAGEDAAPPIAIGGSAGGIPDAALIVQIALGLGYLPLAMLAWRGRPGSIRQIIMAGVVLLTLTTALMTVVNLSSVPTVQGGIDSGEDLKRGLLVSRTIFSALIALYVVWYMNRGPARAFYRGHYLSTPETLP
ncbi:MAG: hypothetical protein L6Q98_06305 [Anaerolineae bacterium]|nr:hypothetical protein [Anaerolineae bacterium]NUQ02795.1 hypothetical protein [Anaerolineae bacterium]